MTRIAALVERGTFEGPCPAGAVGRRSREPSSLATLQNGESSGAGRRELGTFGGPARTRGDDA